VYRADEALTAITELRARATAATALSC